MVKYVGLRTYQHPFVKSYSKKNQQSLHSRTIKLCFRWPQYDQSRSPVHLLDCQCPNLVVSTKIPFIRLFFILGGKFACVRLLLFIYVTLWILHVSHAFQRLAEQILLPFVCCSQGFRLKYLWSKPFQPFTKDFLNGYWRWNLWRMIRIARNRGQQSFYLINECTKIFSYRVCVCVCVRACVLGGHIPIYISNIIYLKIKQVIGNVLITY